MKRDTSLILLVVLFGALAIGSGAIIVDSLNTFEEFSFLGTLAMMCCYLCQFVIIGTFGILLKELIEDELRLADNNRWLKQQAQHKPVYHSIYR